MDDQNFSPEPSTVIEPDIDTVNSGGGKPAVEPTPAPEKPSKPESARDSLEAEAKRISTLKDEDESQDEGKQPVPKEKPAKVDDKPDLKESEAKAKDAAEPEAKTQKPSEGRKIIEAPARFLPRAKELWNNVPHPVREEFDRVMRENDTQTQQYRESHQFREELKPFEEEAKATGTTIKEALTNYVAMEKALRSDPATGFRQLLSNMQMQPQQAISHILSAFNVTPQALAQHISQNPNEYTALAAPRHQQFQQPQPQQQPQEVSPEVKALQEQVNAMRAQQVQTSVVDPFRQEYPEYDQYEDQIAKVLQRGIIEEIHGYGLSPRDRLEVALFMVAPHVRGGNSRQPDDSNSVLTPANTQTPADNLRGGNKSVRSSVGSITDPVEPDRKLSIRETLEEEAKKLSRRA